MATGYAKRVKEILLEHGCEFVRHGKGDHDVWQSPISNARLLSMGRYPHGIWPMRCCGRLASK
jgi:hypothetical protein